MPKKGESKYKVKVGDIHKYWKVLEINVMTIEGKNKDRKAYSNALCLCTKCNKNTQTMSYSRLYNPNECFKCTECDGQKKRTTEEYINELKIKNPLAKLKDGEIYINSITSLVHICSMCGEEYNCLPDSVTGNHKQSTCAHCSNIIRSKKLIKRTTEEYIKELVIRNPFVKLKEGQIYKSCNTKSLHICSRCKKDWNISPITVLRGVVMCKKCASKMFESVHATLIKQVYKHIYGDDCIWEDPVTIGDNTYEIDIVNHERKEAIEVDGEQHNKINNFHVRSAKKNNTTPEYEFEQQQIRDDKVDNYFLEIGYNLIRIQVDNNKTPIQALQEIFPQYDYIPNWIDFSGKITRHKWDVAKAQEMMNNNINRSEIARQLNIHQSSLNQAVAYGNLVIPEGYKSLNVLYWDVNEVQTLLDQGKEVKEISKILNIKKTSIWSALYSKKLHRVI